MFFAQTTNVELSTAEEQGIFAGFMIYVFITLAIWLLYIIAVWKMFEKAEEPGWKAIVPFLNIYTHFRIAGRNGWWMLALIVPILNVIAAILLAVDTAKHFGKSTLFGVIGLFFFSFFGYIIIGYGDAKYVGPKHQ